jgi:hypothetical protein
VAEVRIEFREADGLFEATHRAKAPTGKTPVAAP